MRADKLCHVLPGKKGIYLHLAAAVPGKVAEGEQQLHEPAHAGILRGVDESLYDGFVSRIYLIGKFFEKMIADERMDEIRFIYAYDFCRFQADDVFLEIQVEGGNHASASKNPQQLFLPFGIEDINLDDSAFNEINEFFFQMKRFFRRIGFRLYGIRVDDGEKMIVLMKIYGVRREHGTPFDRVGVS